jgi:lipopolysaccharide biosynthesis protein
MVKRILDMLSDKVGMVAPPDYLMMPEQPSGWGSNIEYAQHVLDQCHVDINLEEQFPVIEFPQGSMFWARTDFLKKMLSAPIKFSDFPEEPIGVDGTIAHALERLFYVWGLDTGLEVRQVFLPGEEQLMRIRR